MTSVPETDIDIAFPAKSYSFRETNFCLVTSARVGDYQLWFANR